MSIKSVNLMNFDVLTSINCRAKLLIVPERDLFRGDLNVCELSE